VPDADGGNAEDGGGGGNRPLRDAQRVVFEFAAERGLPVAAAVELIEKSHAPDDRSAHYEDGLFGLLASSRGELPRSSAGGRLTLRQENT
jgi:hypothetical protein